MWRKISERETKIWHWLKTNNSNLYFYTYSKCHNQNESMYSFRLQLAFRKHWLFTEKIRTVFLFFRRVLDFLPFSHYLPSKDNKQFWANFKWFCQTVDEIIKIKQNTYGNVDILDMVLSARDPETGEKLSTVELREESMTFLLAGHEV